MHNCKNNIKKATRLATIHLTYTALCLFGATMEIERLL